MNTFPLSGDRYGFAEKGRLAKTVGFRPGQMDPLPVFSNSQQPERRPSSSLEVYLLGLVDFDSALFLQERLAREVAERDDLQGKLLLCEHPPIITVGREGSASHIRAEELELISRGLEVRWLNRGGGCIIHSPGQLAAYPIVPLDRLQVGLGEHRRRLECAVTKMCDELRIPAFRREGKPGVWCRTGKFAEVGVAVRSWVAYHGLYINVSTPCDLLKLVESHSDGSADWVTTLSAQRHDPVSMHVVREGMLRHLASQLGYDEYHIYTGHPMLKRTRRRIHVPA